MIESENLPEDHEVILVTVVDPHVTGTFIDLAEAERINLFETVERYQGDVSVRLQDRGINCRAVVVSDISAADALLSVAGKESPSVIVMSSHGRGAVGRWLLGSVAEKLVRGAECPIIVIPMR